MEKYIDEELHKEILSCLNKYGIDKNIISTADNMEIDLVKLIYDKIINCNVKDKDKNIDAVSKNILGIYGNYVAYLYYKGLGYNVFLEYPIYDENNKIITKADLAFFDRENNLNLCEVKTAFEIILSKVNYRKIKEDNNKLDIIKYLNIGKKLLKQVKKLKRKSNNVNVIIFNKCYVDGIIKDILNKNNVNIKLLSLDVYELYNQIKNNILDIYNVYHMHNQLKIN